MTDTKISVARLKKFSDYVHGEDADLSDSHYDALSHHMVRAAPALLRLAEAAKSHCDTGAMSRDGVVTKGILREAFDQFAFDHAAQQALRPLFER